MMSSRTLCVWSTRFCPAVAEIWVWMWITMGSMVYGWKAYTGYEVIVGVLLQVLLYPWVMLEEELNSERGVIRPDPIHVSRYEGLNEGK